MLTTDECFYIGYVKKAHGLNGELEIVLDVDDPQPYQKKESVLLKVGNNLIPFFVQKITLRQRSAVVQFMNVNTLEDYTPLIGTEVWLPLSELPPLTGKKQFYFHEIIGFEVVDHEKGSIGIVKSVIDQAKQPVLQIEGKNNEILIPVVDEFLQEVNRKDKRIYIQAPEGLIDLYS